MPGEAYGTFTGVFTGDVTFDWSPEPLIVANEIRSMAGALMDMGPPLEGARDIAAQNIEKHFAEEKDPSGADWEPWSASYEPYAGPSILTKTGAMRAAATSPSAFDVNVHPGGGDVAFTGAGVPWYWEIHQSGSEGRTSRWGTPNPLPQRAFVGLDEEGELAVIDLFDEWVAAIVGGFGSSLYTHPSGWVQHRLPSGRFGRRVR